MKRAPIFFRFLALSIDLLVLSFFCVIAFIFAFAGYLSGIDEFALLNISVPFLIFLLSSSFIFLFYFTYLTMDGGMTVGKSIFRIKVVRRDGMEVDLFRSLLRSVFYVLSASICFIGFFMALFLKGKALHDIVADTRVIKGETL